QNDLFQIDQEGTFERQSKYNNIKKSVCPSANPLVKLFPRSKCRFQWRKTSNKLHKATKLMQSGADQSQLTTCVHEHEAYISTAQLSHIKEKIECVNLSPIIYFVCNLEDACVDSVTEPVERSSRERAKHRLGVECWSR
ncbi:hypothetical protein SFRURICE_002284, partial [Spodoptera frugiperda]